MNKPQGIMETNHLMELKDKTEYSRAIYSCLQELYGVCYEDASIDERTGEIEDKYS